MNYIIRLATEDDCNELAKLKHKVWQTTYRGIYSDDKIDDFDYEKSINSFKKITGLTPGKYRSIKFRNYLYDRDS